MKTILFTAAMLVAAPAFAQAAPANHAQHQGHDMAGHGDHQKKEKQANMDCCQDKAAKAAAGKDCCADKSCCAEGEKAAGADAHKGHHE